MRHKSVPNTIQLFHTETHMQTHTMAVCTKPSLERNINGRRFLIGVLFGEINGERWLRP